MAVRTHEVCPNVADTEKPEDRQRLVDFTGQHAFLGLQPAQLCLPLQRPCALTLSVCTQCILWAHPSETTDGVESLAS